MPRRAVHSGLVAGMNVFARPAAPALATGNQFELDDAFRAEKYTDLAVETLRGEWHEYAAALFQGSQHFGPVDDLGEVRRADLFFAFGDKHEIDGQLAAGPANGVKRREKSRFRAFLIHRTAADEHFAETRPVNYRGVPRGRGPFGRVHLLDVVHEIEAERARCAGVEGGEDAGLAVGRYLGDLAKARIAQHAHGELAAFAHAAILGGDGGLVDPFLQALHGFAVAFFDFRADGVDIVGVAARPARQREGRS